MSEETTSEDTGQEAENTTPSIVEEAGSDYAEGSLQAALSEAWDELSDGADEGDTDTETADPAEGDGSQNDQAEADDETDDAEQDSSEESQVEAPAHWSAETKAKFDSLDDAAKTAVLDLAKSQEADYTRKTQELAEQRKGIEPLQGVIQQFGDYLGQVGVTADQAVSTLLQTEYGLRNGTPDQKQQILSNLAQQYGVELGMPQGASQADQTINRLQAQIQELQSQIQGFSAQQQQQQSQTIEQQISEFQSAKSDHGKPLHPHFEAVQEDMAKLITGGYATDLKEAYDKAVWANPETRAKLLADQSAAKAKENDAKAKRAKEAGKSVRPKRGPEKPTTPKTVQDAASAAWDQLAG